MNTGVCVCGCPAAAHDHYTEATYCSQCGEGACEHYRRADAWWRRWRT